MILKFGMTECKSISTPLDQNLKLRLNSGKACDQKRFRHIVRSLIYLTITRPDLSYPVGIFSQFMAWPTVEHLQCAEHILSYVSGYNRAVRSSTESIRMKRVHRMLTWKTQIWEKPWQPTDCKISLWEDYKDGAQRQRSLAPLLRQRAVTTEATTSFSHSLSLPLYTVTLYTHNEIS